jgi:hypothetical protein
MRTLAPIASGIRVRELVCIATLSNVTTWRCAHCGTQQTSGSRCWVCSRSPMSCSTCRNYRQGVTARMGFCSLDRMREPLTGDEIRACWQAPIVAEPPVGLFAMVEALIPQADPELSAARPRPTPPRARPVRHLRWTPAADRAPERELVAIPIATDGEGSARPAGPDSPSATVVSGALPAQQRPVAKSGPAGEPPRTPGRLLEAPRVSPALRLQSRDDPRSIRDADLSPRGTLGRSGPAPGSGADGERDNPLQRGPVS